MIQLRQAVAEDKSFLWELHIASMRQYVEATYGWDANDQEARFHAGFQPANLWIIEVDGDAVGMWETDRLVDPWFLIRIVVLPAYQNKGIGSLLIKALLADADSQEQQVILQVLKVNPARSLYERLGFLTYEETTTHFKMLRKPSSDS